MRFLPRLTAIIFSCSTFASHANSATPQQMVDAYKYCEVYGFVMAQFADYAQQKLPQAQWHDRLAKAVQDKELADTMIQWNEPEKYQGLTPDTARTLNSLSCLDEKVGSQDPAQQVALRQSAQRCQRENQNEEGVRRCFIDAQMPTFELALKAREMTEAADGEAGSTEAMNEPTADTDSAAAAGEQGQQQDFCSVMSDKITKMYSAVTAGQDPTDMNAFFKANKQQDSVFYAMTRLDWLLQVKGLQPASTAFLLYHTCEIEQKMSIQTQTRWSMPTKALACQHQAAGDQRAALHCIKGELDHMVNQATQLQLDLLKPDVQMTEAIRAHYIATASMPDVAAVRRFLNDVLADKVQAAETPVKAQLLALAVPRKLLQERWILGAGYRHPEGGSRYVMMSKIDHNVNIEFWTYQETPGGPWVIRDVKRVELEPQYLELANGPHRRLYSDPVAGI